MKSLRIVINLALILAVTSCIYAQGNRTVRGNGNVVKKERTAQSFEGIKVSTGIDVYLKQGDKESIIVEADENLHEYIITEVKSGVLHIYYDNVNVREVTVDRVYVTMRNVKSVETSSAGDIIGESTIKTDDIRIGTSSAGDIKLDLSAVNVDVNISSAGNITLTGVAQTLEADLSSAGELKAEDLQVKEADVNVSSAGNATVNVSEKIIARASSAGDIRYYGDPRYVDAHSSSAGSIRKR